MSAAQDAVVGRRQSPSLLAAAVALVLKRPWRWFGLYLLWLLAVESLMFVPVVGFVLKLALAGITAVSLYHVLDRLQAGEAPGVRELLFGFRLPLSSQLMLAAASLLPFAAGLVVLAVTQGRAAPPLASFYQPLRSLAPPNPRLTRCW